MELTPVTLLYAMIPARTIQLRAQLHEQSILHLKMLLVKTKMVGAFATCYHSHNTLHLTV